MAISVNDFRVAAQQLGDAAPLRLKEDGSGIATSRWERFKVGFFDLFRSADTIAAKKTQTMQTFLEAIRREQGKNMGKLAEAHLRDDFGGMRAPLSGRAVTSTTDLLARRGGQNWLQNEQLIRQAAHCSGPDSAHMPTLAAIANPVCEELVSVAQERGLPKELAQELLLKYTIGPSQFGDAAFQMPNVSDAIEGALRKAAEVRTEGGVSLRRLEMAEVIQIARDATRTAIANEINAYFHDQFDSAHPFEEDLLREATRRGLADHLPVFSSYKTMHGFSELETYARQDATEVVSPEKLQQIREQTIDKILTRQQEKLDLIAGFHLPDSPARTDIIETCMGVRSQMDARYFAQVETAAQKFAAFAERVAGGLSLEEQRDAAMELGEALARAFSASGALGGDDAGIFISLGLNLFLARAGEGGIDAISQWISTPDAQLLQDQNIDLMGSEVQAERTAAVALNFAFGMFSDVDRLR